MLSVLGVSRSLGRFFTAAEDAPEGPPVTVLSHEAWETRYRATGVLGANGISIVLPLRR